MNRKKHWNSAYGSRPETQLGWYKPHLELSLRLIRDTGVERDAKLIDVGGGASTLVDDLLDAGFSNVWVLDVSEAALESAKCRLGPRADRVKWIVADIADTSIAEEEFDLWHDRAVFHFLTSSTDRLRYVENLTRSLTPGGHVIMATFSLTGPRKCSGLRVVRYSPESLHSELDADEFALLEAKEESHQTPSGVAQDYIYCHFRRRGHGGVGEVAGAPER